MDPINRVAVEGAGLGYVAVGGRSLWLNESPPGAVSRWRLDTLRLQHRYPLGPGAYPLEVGYAGGAAWFALADSGNLLRVGADGVTTRASVASGIGGPPTAGFGSIWVSADGGYLLRVDMATLLPRVVVRVGADAFGVGVGAGSVWVAGQEDGTVSRIDPRSGRILATIDVGYFPQWLAVDERSVWVGVSSERWGLGD
jgi:streptogramin lyase